MKALAGRSGKPSLGQSVFTHGLANTLLWTNYTQMVDVDFDWCLNKSVKVYLDSEHAFFGNPVVDNTDRFQRSNDLYWLRLQVYF